MEEPLQVEYLVLVRVDDSILVHRRIARKREDKKWVSSSQVEHGGVGRGRKVSAEERRGESRVGGMVRRPDLGYGLGIVRRHVE